MSELSIIVPIYKVEKYLHRCVDSILNQTFQDFELILIDDGSPDNCGAICDEYAVWDSRVKVIHQSNSGVSAARNAGLDVASGTYLGFIDADDWIEPMMYETLITTAKQKQMDMVACGINYFKEDGSFLYADLKREAVLDREMMLESLYEKPNPFGGGCCNKLFRAESIRDCRFEVGMSLAEDWLYLFRSISRLCSGCIISSAYHNVTERDGSATRSERTESYMKILKSSDMMLQLAREHSVALESKATDKYLDDCLRYTVQMCKTGRKTGQPYRMKRLKVKIRMLRTILRAWAKRILPRAKINGYIMGMIKL